VSTFASIKQSQRHLFTFSFPRDQALFVSNAGVFALDWSLTKSPEAPKHIAHIRDKKITVFCQEPWFIGIDPTHYPNKWGQCFEELPAHMRELFLKEISSNHPKHEPLTFKQAGELQQAAVEKVRRTFNKYGVSNQFVEVSDASTFSVENTSDGYLIKLDGNSYFLSRNTFFYNWVKVFRQHTWKNLSQCYPSHLYRLPKNFFKESPVKNLIVQGASMTIPWIIRDFDGVKSCNIALIRRKNDKIDLSPRNSHIDISDILHFIVDEETGDITNENGAVKMDVFAKSTDSESVGRTKYADIASLTYSEGDEKFAFTGHFYTTMGFLTNVALTQNVPKESKLVLPERAYFDSLESRSGMWIAPKDVPFGSLTQSYLLWMSKTNNIKYSYEPQSYHKNILRFLFKTISKDIFLDQHHSRLVPAQFFDAIDKHVSSMKIPVDPAKFHDIFEKEFHDTLKVSMRDTLEEYTRGPNFK
jgi:hypothetical protein